MRRPLIGLTTYAQQVQYGKYDVLAGMLPMVYVKAVHATGGRAVVTMTSSSAGVRDTSLLVKSALY